MCSSCFIINIHVFLDAWHQPRIKLSRAEKAAYAAAVEGDEELAENLDSDALSRSSSSNSSSSSSKSESD